LSAQPPAGAGTAERLGPFVADGRPPVRFPFTREDRWLLDHRRTGASAESVLIAGGEPAVVVELVTTAMAQPLPEPPADSVAEIGGRVTRIIGEQPNLAGYVGRALVDGSPLGATIFDTLMTMGKIRWQQRAERGETRSDVDLTWAAITRWCLRWPPSAFARTSTGTCLSR
jgi:hypothetical protein